MLALASFASCAVNERGASRGGLAGSLAHAASRTGPSANTERVSCFISFLLVPPLLARKRSAVPVCDDALQNVLLMEHPLRACHRRAQHRYPERQQHVSGGI